MSVAGLILAAGESRRMGSPKALLPFRGENFLDHLIGRLAQHCSPVIVVLGYRPGVIRDGIRRECQIVINPDYAQGQITSMQCGLRAAPADAEGVLFTLVDHPNVRPSTLAKLIAHRQHLIVIPRHQGRRGHPIFFSCDLIPEFLALSGDSRARDVVERHSAEICFVDVDDPGILDDVDDPAAYQRLLAAQV